MIDFTDMENRILLKLDAVDSKVDDLCGRMIRQETNLENHLESQRARFNKTTVILGIAVTLIAVVVGLK